ncbi:D-alanyl-D-alanine carboxypeptidase [Pedococcus dokdonensis]|uniref:D-alanyl-D-alanine carboxypeptidase n=1 Tax=Pedococcus dokdonensis TaxID=443156 RepID=A0A1H0MX85_9MICO|nr:M15 family metallopeptidase [Pedococcus dokdonensis]SDO84972.1 D-alanyl-D-alanine carboxypeptidase [Pedococcus dokdonensis]
MSPDPLTHTPLRPTRSTALAVALLVAAAAVALVALTPLDLTSLGLGSRTETGTVHPGGSAAGSAIPPNLEGAPVTHDARPARTTPTAAPGEGAPAGTSGGGSVLDETDPTVANLDPDLLAALRTAAGAARDDGVELGVNSGWRSAAEQERLLDQAITQYGSEREARRWVATPETSEHVSGDAVDVGPTRAASWLERNGAAYGLCRVYRNEPWHFELRQGAALDGCPRMYADPTQDPRMSR